MEWLGSLLKRTPLKQISGAEGMSGSGCCELFLPIRLDCPLASPLVLARSQKGVGRNTRVRDILALVTSGTGDFLSLTGEDLLTKELLCLVCMWALLCGCSFALSLLLSQRCIRKPQERVGLSNRGLSFILLLQTCQHKTSGC